MSSADDLVALLRRAAGLHPEEDDHQGRAAIRVDEDVVHGHAAVEVRADRLGVGLGERAVEARLVERRACARAARRGRAPRCPCRLASAAGRGRTPRRRRPVPAPARRGRSRRSDAALDRRSGCPRRRGRSTRWRSSRRRRSARRATSSAAGSSRRRRLDWPCRLRRHCSARCRAGDVRARHGHVGERRDELRRCRCTARCTRATAASARSSSLLFIAAASGPFAADATEIFAALGVGFATLPISSSALAALLRTPIDGSLATRRASSGAASHDRPLTPFSAQHGLVADALVAVAEQADRLGDPARRLRLRRDLSRQADRRVARLGLGASACTSARGRPCRAAASGPRQRVEDVAAGLGAALHRLIQQRQERRRVLRSGAPRAPWPPLPRSSCRRSSTPCASGSRPPPRSSRAT